MSHRPTFVSQLRDPNTDLDFALCTMACGAMALDYHTRGRFHMTGGQLVQKTTLTRPEISDGTNLGDVAQAWRKISQERKDPSIVLQVRKNTGWSDVQDALANGRAVILQGNYNVLPRQFKCQDKPLKGKGGHAILLLPERKKGAILVGDPLCKGFSFIPEANLKAFAEAFTSPSNVLHANTRAFPPDEEPAPPPAKTPRTATAQAPAVASGPAAGLDPTLDPPAAICDVIGPTDLFDDPDGVKKLVTGWIGAVGVGLYTRPHSGDTRQRAAIRIDTKKGAGEKWRIAWVAATAISNVRLRTS